MKTFAPYYNRYNNFAGKQEQSDFLPIIAAGAGIATAVGGLFKSIGGLFGGSGGWDSKTEEMAYHCNNLAQKYMIEKRSPDYIKYERSFLHGVGGPVYGDAVQAVAASYYALIGKPVSTSPQGYIFDYASKIQPKADQLAQQLTDKAKEIEDFNNGLRSLMGKMTPMTPEMIGLAYIDASVVQNQITSQSQSQSGSIKETISKNKNTILIVVIVLLVLTIIGYFIVKAVRR